MFRNGILFLLLIIAVNSYAQEDAWVYLTDKPNLSDALLSPIAILTHKAIDRRKSHPIAIDARDVPVNQNYITDLKSQIGITVLAKSKWFNAIRVRGSEADIKALLSLSYFETINFSKRNLNIGKTFSELIAGISHIKISSEETTNTFKFIKQ